MAQMRLYGKVQSVVVEPAVSAGFSPRPLPAPIARNWGFDGLDPD